MTFAARIFRSKFFIKLRHWEYWPFGILQAPFFLYWFWLSIKARSFFFFSASNPTIYTGGMMGESKKEALDLVPDSLKPKTILIKLPTHDDAVQTAMKNSGLDFPVIFKPDLGERGWLVRKIHNQEDLKQYLTEVPTDFLIQEFIDLPLEFGVFYVRKPSEATGKVISINSKEMLAVTGNGQDTLAKLVYKNDRARLQEERLQKIFSHRWHDVIPAHEVIVLNTIGNHCLGTKFMNGNNLITSKLNSTFDAISKQVDGFYFGRYDLRCASLSDLENGQVKIMELNGCGAEPAHIYQPGFSFWQALGVMYRHWKTLYEISVENHKRGVPYITFAEGRKTYLRTKKIFNSKR
jgi:hypothetical protein